MSLLVASEYGRAAARAAQKLKVDIEVTVHNSDTGVSSETPDDWVGELLEEAGFQVGEAGANGAADGLKIDIYKGDQTRHPHRGGPYSLLA